MATTTTTTTDTATKSEAATKGKRTWPLWKKLTIAAVVLLIVTALAVGLGVGLTRNKGGDPNPDGSSTDTDNDNSNDNDDKNDNDTGNDNGIDDDTDNKNITRPTLWKPEPATSWQIILQQPIKLNTKSSPLISPDVDVYDLDLYEGDVETFKALQDEGKHVICYFSAGSYENYREDKDEFDDADLGKVLDGWPDERWLNLSSPSVRNIIKKRIKVAAEKGCDAIDPDNVDGYQNDNGLDLTPQDSISFVKFLASEAAKYNMSTGLKNAGDIIPDVLSDVAFSVNEQCIQYSECDTFSAFIDDGKPVFNIEYPDGAPKVKDSDRKRICGSPKGTKDFSTVIKKMDLDGWVMYCPDKTYETDIDS